MKKLLTILCLVLLVSCSKEVEEENLQYRDELSYEINSTTPFTGSSVVYDKTGQLEQKYYYKKGRFVSSEIYYPNGKLRVTWKLKTRDNGEDYNSIEKCFHSNGQTCWDVRFNKKTQKQESIYFNRNGEQISWELFKKLYYDVMKTY